MFDSIVFDLDGTLWDTCAACAEAWNQVLSEEGVNTGQVTAEDVRRVTGKPHDECIRLTFSHLDRDIVSRLAAATAVADNEVIGRLGGILYPGVGETLERLRPCFRLFIVSNCQSGYIETFLKLNDFEKNFEGLECFGNTGQSKSTNLRALISRHELKDPLMVGDTEGDEQAARDCGIPFAYAAYGFGSAAKPDYRLDNFRDLEAILF